MGRIRELISELLSGEDIYEVRARTQAAIERAHNESRPTLLEIATYRWEGHSVADANKEKYRTKEEVEKYKVERDPIERLKLMMTQSGMTEDDLKPIEKEVKEIVTAAAQFAQESPLPDVSELWTDVLVEAK